MTMANEFKWNYPVMEIIENDNVEEFKICENNPEFLYVKTQDGDFPVHIASKFGSCIIIHFLLRTDPMLATRLNDLKHSALYIACKDESIKESPFYHI